jgi:predicted RNase H-like HicB family nuclease
MGNRFLYEAIIEDDGDGTLAVYFPDIIDAFSYGHNLKEASVNAVETLELALADYIAAGEEPPSPVYGHDIPDGSRCVLVYAEVTEEDVRRMGFVSSLEAAQALGISSSRVAQLAASGQLESIGRGTSRLISLESINARKSVSNKPGRPKKKVSECERELTVA